MGFHSDHGEQTGLRQVSSGLTASALLSSPQIQLFQKEPNPFTPGTFEVENSGPSELAVWDNAGRQAAMLAEQSPARGDQRGHLGRSQYLRGYCAKSRVAAARNEHSHRGKEIGGLTGVSLLSTNDDSSDIRPSLSSWRTRPDNSRKHLTEKPLCGKKALSRRPSTARRLSVHAAYHDTGCPFPVRFFQASPRPL